MSEPSTGDETSQLVAETEHKEDDHGPPRKRQRVRLSCLECRRRKLSCDREFPCSRCLQSGTADRCEYEVRPGLAPPNKLGLSQSPLASFDTRLSLPNGGGREASPYRKDPLRDHDRIRKLELEITQLKALVVKQVGLDGTTIAEQSPTTQPSEDKPEEEPKVPPFIQSQHEASSDKDELRFFRGKEFKTRYFGPYNACVAFSEVGALSPFVSFFS